MRGTLAGSLSTVRMLKHVFLTGSPGVGKTTLVRKVCETMVSAGVNVDGFYTEELREQGRRVGFDVVTLTGDRCPLSRLGNEAPPGRCEYRVGQYVVHLSSFENLVLPIFQNMGKGNVFVIDEIGKMELFSQTFISTVRHALDSSVCTILGTIPVPKGKPVALLEEIRARKDVKVFMVTKDNRDTIADKIVSTLKECLSNWEEDTWNRQ